MLDTFGAVVPLICRELIANCNSDRKFQQNMPLENLTWVAKPEYSKSPYPGYSHEDHV